VGVMEILVLRCDNPSVGDIYTLVESSGERAIPAWVSLMNWLLFQTIGISRQENKSTVDSMTALVVLIC